MVFATSKSVSFQDDPEAARCSPTKREDCTAFISSDKGEEAATSRLKNQDIHAAGRSFQDKKLSRVFSEDYGMAKRNVFDPRGHVLSRWNKIFLLSSLISLFIDPLFFYLPSVEEGICMQASVTFETVLTVVRSLVDAFYGIQIFIRFRTAYNAPSSRVFGRGELVISHSKIASRYLRKDFWMDLLGALPLPQVLIWAVLPSLMGSTMISGKHGFRITIIFQFLLRLYLIFPLSSKIIKTAGVMVEAAWAGAAFNLLLFMLASHVIGSCWYLLAVERQEGCWKKVCDIQQPNCRHFYFDCQTKDEFDRRAWFESSNISLLCGPGSDFYNFGIYSDALTYSVTKSSFLHKYTYCFWWGLRNLSSIGQNLITTSFVGEINFAITIAILGLVLFALLIGNMQAYLQSSTARLEEWRVRRNDTEQWMHHRQLPHVLKERVRKYDLFRWVAARGVDEESILRDLPLDLRRDIKHHICLDLVRRVPLFDEMDSCTLDAICERLKPVLCTPTSCIVREGDPVIEMLFILRGHLESYTTNGGRTGFFNSCRLGLGDFCGEELLSWALYPRPSILLPSSTRTVMAMSEVEAFALVAEDVKFVASQFRKLHSKQLKHKFRFHSHQWRMWAACFIQAAWFRYKRRREASELKARERVVTAQPKLVAAVYCSSLPASASEFATCAVKVARSSSSTRARSLRNSSRMDFLNVLEKPVEPDFSVDQK